MRFYDRARLTAESQLTGEPGAMTRHNKLTTLCPDNTCCDRRLPALCGREGGIVAIEGQRVRGEAQLRAAGEPPGSLATVQRLLLVPVPQRGTGDAVAAGPASWVRPAPPPLVGRAAELAAVTDLLRPDPGGRRPGLLVTGPSGAGKSALLAAAAHLAGPGTAVRRAAAEPADRGSPFSYARQVLAVAGWAGGASPPADVLRHRVQAELGEAAAAGRLLLVLDDLQWADPASLDLLGAALGRRRPGGVQVVAAARPWPHLPVDVLAGPGAGAFAVAALAPLAATDTGALLADRLGACPSVAVAERVHAATGGIPGLVVEAAAALALDGPARRPLLAPDRAEPVLRRLLHGLPAAARSLLQAVVVVTAADRPGPTGLPAVTPGGGEGTVGDPPGAAPPGVPLLLVAAVAGEDIETVAVACDALVAAGLVAVDRRAGTARVVPPLVADAVDAALAPGRRWLLHRRAFEHLAAAGDLAAAADHACRAGLVGDPAALAAAQAAAAQALAAGPPEPALHQLAVAHQLAGPGRRLDLLEQRAGVLLAAGRPAEALRALRRVLRQPLDPDHCHRLLASVARAHELAGSLGAARAVLDDLVARPAPALPAEPLVRRRAELVWQLDGPAAALDALQPLLPTSGPPGAGPGRRRPLEAAVAATMAQLLAAQLGRPVLSDSLDGQVAAAMELLAAGGDPDALAAIVTWYGARCAADERFADAERILRAGARQLHARGALASASAALAVLAAATLQQGRPADALAVVDDAERGGATVPSVEPYLHVVRALAWTWLGRLADADAALAAAGPARADESWLLALWRGRAIGRRLIVRGRAADAACVYLHVHATARRAGLADPALVPWAADAVTALLAAGRLADAAGVVDAVEACLGEGRAWPAMVAAAGRAGLAAARGDRAAADEHYRAAVVLPAVNPLHRAEVLVHYGSWLRRWGRARQARPVLAEAAATAEAARAAPLASTARAELAAAGGRRRAVRAGDTDGLSPQQQRVAELAVGGAPVKEIAGALHLSPRTVETHLANVYRRLGVSGKAELRRRWAGQPGAVTSRS